MKKTVIIIPTYNEHDNIKKLIPYLQEKVLPRIKNYRVEILVADDNSPDGTSGLVRELIKKYNNLHLITGPKDGLGAAYIRAMEYAVDRLGASVFFQFDGDGSHDADKIPLFLEKIDEGFDMVIGTRYSQGGSIPENWPLIRKAYSICGNLLVRIVLGRFSIHDWTGGFRALKSNVFITEKSKLTQFKGYTFQVSFLHKAIQDGYQVYEIPFNFTDRINGKSKIAPSEYIVTLLRYIFTARFYEVLKSPFPKFLIVGGFGFILNAIIYEILVRNTDYPLALANIVAAQAAIFSNFNFNNLWTFKSRKSHNFFSYLKKMAQFFVTSNTGVIFIQSGIIAIGEHFFGKEHYRVYFLIGTFFLLIWNFTLYNKVIWRKKHK